LPGTSPGDVAALKVFLESSSELNLAASDHESDLQSSAHRMDNELKKLYQPVWLMMYGCLPELQHLIASRFLPYSTYSASNIHKLG